jgi:hypothetical protein
LIAWLTKTPSCNRVAASGLRPLGSILYDIFFLPNSRMATRLVDDEPRGHQVAPPLWLIAMLWRGEGLIVVEIPASSLMREIAIPGRSHRLGRFVGLASERKKDFQ